ncbi:hypothetical protein [Paenibacillus rhizophilus]|uniref:Uncharacterized protein n=1 Tax=Paenibacillus rhizophilus TaxID=1850366 RepID=A0A3N9Q3X5_9BACL|nr:hypothetical protein [Paenibacillus rhizophilus]RQW13452.1 hypothetical protein EH198_03245 [Paenibacillus rhizophilus]
MEKLKNKLVKFQLFIQKSMFLRKLAGGNPVRLFGKQNLAFRRIYPEEFPLIRPLGDAHPAVRFRMNGCRPNKGCRSRFFLYK